MKEEFSSAPKAILSYECENCGQGFESWARLRQHQVDCQSEDFDPQA